MALLVRLGASVALVGAVLSTCVAGAARPAGFGNEGYAIWHDTGAPSSLGVQRSGRVVFSAGWYVSALTPSGAHDPRFRSRLLVRAGCDPSGCPHLVVQPDDRIVVAGLHTVFRLRPSGVLDSSFGNEGRVDIPGMKIQSVALAAHGAIVVAGAQSRAISTDERGGPARVARLLPTGTLDASFGQGGSVSLDHRLASPVAVAIQPDNHLVVVGLWDDRGSPIARLGGDGSLDVEFGEGGVVGIARLSGRVVAVQPDGRIIVGGLRWPEVPGSGLPVATFVRLDGLGRPDPSFGQDGVAVINARPVLVDMITGLALQPDGALITAGTSLVPGSNKASYSFVARVTSKGHVTRFSYEGTGLIDPDHDCFAEGASALALQPDAMVLVGGSVCDLTAWVARYTPNLRLDAGSPLRISRVQPRGRAPVRAARTGSVVRLATTVRASAPSHVAVSVRRAELFEGIPGKKIPVWTGGRVSLLPGTVVGGVRLKRRARTVEADSSRTGRLALRLLLPTRAFPRGGWGLVTVRARDDRGRMATLEIEFVTR